MTVRCDSCGRLVGARQLTTDGCELCHGRRFNGKGQAFDASKDDSFPRVIDGTVRRCTFVEAMMERAKPGQWRADFPPEEPAGFNRENPDPGKVFYIDDDQELRSREKYD